jgi:polyketide cyclase/dehydrase/lipid transport protein
MKPYRVASSAKIRARSAQVYAAIADYKHQHPHIIPPEYFRRLEVLEGGVGAGTRTRVEMHVLGTTRVFEQVVTEPTPGHTLVESNQDGSGVTTFTVDAADGGESALVTIATDFVARPGLTGFLERMVTSVMVPRIYRAELAQLEQYMARQRPSPEASSGRPAI